MLNCIQRFHYKESGKARSLQKIVSMVFAKCIQQIMFWKKPSASAFQLCMCSMQAMIEEMRTGQPYALPKEGIAQSKLAAGPTTIEDLVSSS